MITDSPIQIGSGVFPITVNGLAGASIVMEAVAEAYNEGVHLGTPVKK